VTELCLTNSHIVRRDTTTDNRTVKPQVRVATEKEVENKELSVFLSGPSLSPLVTSIERVPPAPSSSPGLHLKAPSQQGALPEAPLTGVGIITEITGAVFCLAD
jgi:hypothetical protein